MDKATTNGERISYARCFVEVKESGPFLEQVSLVAEDGENLSVEIEYEWVPPSCPR